MITTMDILKFIIKYRSNETFRFCSYLQIATLIEDGIKNASIVVVNDKDGNIVGVAHGYPFEDDKTFFVWNILTIQSGVIKTCLMKFKELWPNYTLQAERRDKMITYNTPKLLNKFHIL